MADTPSPIKTRAIDVARSVITAIHGPRPDAAFGPAGEGPRATNPGITEDQFLRHMGGLAAGRAWDRRVAALANALANEARCIEDRAVEQRRAA